MSPDRRERQKEREKEKEKERERERERLEGGIDRERKINRTDR